MIDSSLSNLYPIVQIGSDGFQWWIGQIESEKQTDLKGGDRWKVRIIGIHPQTCDEVKSEDLPWAICMHSVSNPHTPGGNVSVTTQLADGAWVVGFFLDQEKQQPVIMGSIGRVPASKTDADSEPTPGVGCNSFTTFLDPENKKEFEQPVDKEEGISPTPTEAGHTSNKTTKFQEAKTGNSSTNNQAGLNVCVEVADPCGKDTNVSQTMTRLFSEMLYETQRNNGKLGDYLVGEVSGKMYDSVSIGRKYTNKAIRVIRSFIAKIKGFVVEKIKEAVKTLTDALLRPTELGNALTTVTNFFNTKLALLGCAMEDLADRLASWLSEVIFGYLFNIYKETACQVDKFVGGILSKIQSTMEDLLEGVLGPLQAILGAIASPINMMGDAINYVLNLLGIQCSGPKKECANVTKVCSHGKTEKRDEGDWLDGLLNGIEDMNDAPPDWNTYTCDDAYEGTKLSETDVSFIGGIQDPQVRPVINYTITDLRVTEGDIAEFVVKRSGFVDIASSVSYSTRNGTAMAGSDYLQTNGVLGFVAGETEKTIQVRTIVDSEDEYIDEDFFMRIYKLTPTSIRSTTTKNIARCQISDREVRTQVSNNNLNESLNVNNPSFPNFNPEGEVYEDPLDPDADNGTTVVTEDGVTTTTTDGESTSQQAVKEYAVTADRASVKEGEFVTYIITTQNVPNGSILGYTLFGTDITPDDIVGGSMTGSFEIEDNTSTVVVGISEDGERENDEGLIFSINGTGSRTSVLITSDASGLTDEELRQRDDSSSPIVTLPEKLKVPTVGDIITDSDGGIIHIPVINSGDPYKEPPNIFVTGEGFRASAIPLLDSNGFITEIRITDPGYNYKLNTSDNTRKECIIDAFTLIKPGQEYTSTPKVYVNGDERIAEAIIEDGRIVSVRIKDRSRIYTSHPKVTVVGGGGYGAKVIASIVCLDPDTRVAIGSAKIGTGSYVDCP